MQSPYTYHCFNHKKPCIPNRLQSQRLELFQLTIGLRSCQDNLGYNWIFRHQTFRSTRVHQAKERQKEEGKLIIHSHKKRLRWLHSSVAGQLCRALYVQLQSSQSKLEMVVKFYFMKLAHRISQDNISSANFLKFASLARKS